MSGTLPISSDKYEEDTSGQVSTVTDNVVADTQQAGNVVREMSNEQSNSDNLANLEDDDGDRVNTDQLPPNVVIETVSYEDYIKQRDGQIVEEREGGDNIEVIERLDDDEEEDQHRPAGRITTSQFLTVTLQCDQCSQMFAKEQLSAHLWNNHQIHPFRCAVKDCAQSFTVNNYLTQHIAQSHQGVTNWQCGKCDHLFGTYILLSKHNTKQHQFGHFQCTFPACPFTGEYKMKMFNHYRQHRQ